MITAEEFKHSYEASQGHNVHELYAIAVLATARGLGHVDITNIEVEVKVNE